MNIRKTATTICTVAFILFAFPACSEQRAQTSTPPSASSEPAASSPATTPSEAPTEPETEEETSDLALTEFSVEIYPPRGVDLPADYKQQVVSFSLELPDNWASEPTDPTSNQYVFVAKDRAATEDTSNLVALIQGDSQPEDPAKPFALATQDAPPEMLASGDVKEIDLLEYPVLRYIYDVGAFDGSNNQDTVYYIYVEGGLIYLQFTAFGDEDLTLEEQREQFDALVATFRLM